MVSLSEREARGEPAFTRRDLDDLDAVRRTLSPRIGVGYQISAVDAFLERAMSALRVAIDENQGIRAGVDPNNLWFAHAGDRLTPADIRGVTFGVVRIVNGYRMRPVDELVERIADALARLQIERDGFIDPSGHRVIQDEPSSWPAEREQREPSRRTPDPQESPVQRFASVRRGYDTDQVDSYVALIEGWINSLRTGRPKPNEVSAAPTSERVRGREFATVRRGYDPDQVRDYLLTRSEELRLLERRWTIDADG